MAIHDTEVVDDELRTFDEAFPDGIDGWSLEEVGAVLDDLDVLLGICTREEVAAIHAVLDPPEPLARFAEETEAVAVLAEDDAVVDAALRSFVARGLVEVTGADDEGATIDLLGPLSIVGRTRIAAPFVSLVEAQSADGEDGQLTVHQIAEEVLVEETVDEDGFHLFVMRDLLGEAVALANLIDPEGLAGEEPGEVTEHTGNAAEEALERLREQADAVVVITTYGEIDEDTIVESVVSFYTTGDGVVAASGYRLDDEEVLSTVELHGEGLIELLMASLRALPEDE